MNESNTVPSAYSDTGLNDTFLPSISMIVCHWTNSGNSKRSLGCHCKRKALQFCLVGRPPKWIHLSHSEVSLVTVKLVCFGNVGQNFSHSIIFCASDSGRINARFDFGFLTMIAADMLFPPAVVSMTFRNYAIVHAWSRELW